MRRNFPFLVFCAYNIIQPANAAQTLPNALVTLSGPVVHLSDLFSNAGPEADRVLGNAPPPGGRIVVGTTQLAAIAAAYQVPWQPDGGSDQVVLASPGTAMPASIMESAMAQALATAGGPADPVITLSDFTPPMIPPGTAATVTVTRMNYDPASQKFSASTLVSAPGMVPQNLDLSGVAEASVPALVATHVLRAGEVIATSDVTLARVPQRLGTNAVANPAAAVGMAVGAGVPAGGAITAANLVTPLVITKGAAIVLTLSTPGVVLTEQGVALSEGGLGDLITVINPASHAVVQAVVTGPGAASVAPGSTPLQMAQNSQGYAAQGSYARLHGARLSYNASGPTP
jgi:flagella basal body P-ring formation protein FlgA